MDESLRFAHVARCCRDYLVALYWPIGRCGLYGEKPEPAPGTARDLLDEEE